MPKSERVLAISFFHSTTRWRNGIYLFIIGVVIICTGIFVKIWPITNIIIHPDVLYHRDSMQINVSLDISEPSLSTLTIPGRLLAIGEDVNMLSNQHFIVRHAKEASVVFNENDLIDTAIQSVKSKLFANTVILEKNIVISDGVWSTNNSRSLFQGGVDIVVGYYYQFPISNWQQEITGLNKTEALKVLSLKPGVDKVEIIFYPPFLANFSQKVSSRGQSVRFTLDTDSKTSILE